MKTLRNRKIIFFFMLIILEVIIVFFISFNHPYGERIPYTEFMELVEEGYVEKVEVTEKNQLIIHQYRSNEKLYTINVDQASYIQYLTGNGVEVDGYEVPAYKNLTLYSNFLLVLILILGINIFGNVSIPVFKASNNNESEHNERKKKVGRKIKIPKIKMPKLRKKIKEEKDIKNEGINDSIFPEEEQDEIREPEHNFTYVNEDLEELIGIDEEIEKNGELPEVEIEDPMDLEELTAGKSVSDSKDVSKETDDSQIQAVEEENESKKENVLTEQEKEKTEAPKENTSNTEIVPDVTPCTENPIDKQEPLKEEQQAKAIVSISKVSCIHEASHAMVMAISSRGDKFLDIDLEHPYCDSAKDFGKLKYEFLIRAKTLLASSILIEMLSPDDKDIMADKDYDKAKQLIIEMVGVCKMVKGYNMSVSKYGLSPETKKKFDNTVNESFSRCRKEIQMFFEKYKTLIDKIIEVLMENGRLSKESLEQMMREEIPNFKTCIPDLYNPKQNAKKEKMTAQTQVTVSSKDDEEIFLEVAADEASFTDEADFSSDFGLDNMGLETEGFPEEEPAPPDFSGMMEGFDSEDISQKQPVSENKKEPQKKHVDNKTASNSTQHKKPGFQTQIPVGKSIGKPSLLTQASTNGMKEIRRRNK